MPVLALIDAAALLPARGALIGLDLGTKTIGVAASDPDRRLATPVETIARKRFSADAERFSRSPPNGARSASCSGCRSTWTAPKVRARRRRAPLRATSRTDRAADRVVGRAALDRRGRARADRSRCQPRQAQGGDRPARRRLHPAGRARPAGEHFPGATHHRDDALQNRDLCGRRVWKGPGSAATAAALHRVRDTYVFHPSGSARCKRVSAVRASMSSAP